MSGADYLVASIQNYLFGLCASPVRNMSEFNFVEQCNAFSDDEALEGQRRNEEPLKEVLASSTLPPDTFRAKLHRGGAKVPIGLDADRSDSRTLLVFKVWASEDSPVSKYNQKADDERQISVGDFIIAVNSCGGSAEQLLAELNRSEDPVLTIRRPEVFDVVVERTDDQYGLRCTYAGDGSGPPLLIKEVLAGSVRNSVADVRQGDRIISVEGQTGTAKELLEIMKKKEDQARLRLSRCPRWATLAPPVR